MFRLRCAQELYDVTVQVGHETTHQEVMPILIQLLGDQHEVIRREVIGQIVKISAYFGTPEWKNERYDDILFLLTLVQRYTTDSNPNVRQATMDALVEIGGLLNYEDVLPRLLPIVKSLAKDKTEEEHRVEGAMLLNHLSEIMKEELCLNFAIPYMKELSEDSSFRVQKAVASHLGKICKVVGVEVTTQQILPLFQKLSTNTIWGVRKACVESLVDLSENVTSKEREEILVPMFERLITDSSRWVVMAAYQVLGKFIFSCYNDTVPQTLIDHFKKMTQIKEHCSPCAYNFPAVIYTLGKEKWDNDLYQAYNTLAQDENIKVRISLSSSLHEIAKILETELTEKYLLESFELFMKDLDDVKFGIVSNVPEFYKVLSMEKRKHYIPNFVNIQKDQNWRFRKLVAKHIGSIALLYSSDDVAEHFLPLFDSLKKDPIASVRKALTKSVPQLIKATESNPDLYKKCIKDLQELSKSTSYVNRQLFASICLHIPNYTDDDLFEKEFLDDLLRLAKDPVANVRLIVSKVLFSIRENTAIAEQIADALKELECDKDSDVSYYAQNKVNKTNKGL